MHTIIQNQACTCIHNLHEHTTFLHAHILTCIHIYEHTQSPLNYVLTQLHTYAYTKPTHNYMYISNRATHISHIYTEPHKCTQLHVHIISTKSHTHLHITIHWSMHIQFMNMQLHITTHSNIHVKFMHMQTHNHTKYIHSPHSHSLICIQITCTHNQTHMQSQH